MNSSRRALLLAALGVLAGCERDLDITVYLVRHAEKDTAGDPKDPSLSADGKRRAEALLAALTGVQLAAVYATDLKRTQETVAPVAAQRGISVEVYPAADVAALLARMRAHPKTAVLVAGHSNTVPEIAKALGAKEPTAIGDSEYGDLFVVRCAKGSANVERRRFDAAS